MLTRCAGLLLIGLVAATVVTMPGSAAAQQPIRIGASISLTGTYAVDDRGFQIGHKGVTVQWQDGKQVVVWPQDVAAGKARFPTPPWDKR
jgi:hypothetical protein